MRAAALALLAAVALTGCDGDTERAAPSPTPTPAPTTPAATLVPTVSPTPVEPLDPLSPKPAVESPAPVGQPTCRPADLTLVDADQVDAENAVHEVYVLRTSGPPCQLKGWPTVTFLDAAGRQLALTSRHGGFEMHDDPPEAVTLTRGTSMSFLVGTRREGSCRQAATIVATLPGTTRALRAETGLRLCGSVFGVSPVHRLGHEE